jgi:hypothetical protein
MRQTDIFEFLDELSKLVEDESTPSSTEQDETPTKVDTPPEPSNTLIEDVITHYLEQCLDAGVVPSLDDAKSIAILDQINRSYQ